MITEDKYFPSSTYAEVLLKVGSQFIDNLMHDRDLYRHCCNFYPQGDTLTHKLTCGLLM